MTFVGLDMLMGLKTPKLIVPTEFKVQPIIALVPDNWFVVYLGKLVVTGRSSRAAGLYFLSCSQTVVWLQKSVNNWQDEKPDLIYSWTCCKQFSRQQQGNYRSLFTVLRTWTCAACRHLSAHCENVWWVSVIQLMIMEECWVIRTRLQILSPLIQGASSVWETGRGPGYLTSVGCLSRSLIPHSSSDSTLLGYILKSLCIWWWIRR